ncbi:unnamed protein product [Porites evermanni]|uniref:G-protein coupled receptors family 1 profile domain-containing protein n=1 Tax=Porites evermanni TaxID=104178 RepID=A0ABN8RK41_9CNID|nr:unnamed protein product [Porites evermanni]
MNASTDSVRNHSISCRGRFKEYFLENTVISLFSIALNLGSCPVIIMMNVLVIVAIKTRRRLQSEYNILLACLAGTDLAVGLVSQPLFIAQEILFLSGASLVDYCNFFRKTVFVFLVPCIESLLILAILSTERYLAMKYSLRYASIVTTPRLIGAVVCSWLISTSSLIFWLIPATRSTVTFSRKMEMNVNVSQNSALNVSIICRSREEEYIYILVNTIASLFSITLNLGSCPVIIFMNVLVIVAIKTRRRLQSEYNILLACLAGTDLAVGLVSQPLFIAQEIYFLSGASLVDYCRFYRRIVFVYLVPCIESLLILAILSTERYIAMKYSLRYASIVTTPKLFGVVVCSWFISTIPFNNKHCRRIKRAEKELNSNGDIQSQTAAMNFTNTSATKDIASCRVAKELYFWEYILATLPVIALNLGSCPIIILMNALVIIAIKTRRRLQSNYNILLACLAGTDLAVGLVSQPLFIAQEIFFLSGASVEDYCHFYRKTVFFCLFPSIESLLILALLSIERYIAIKFSLRYASLITTPRLIGAVLCSWIISVISVILWLIPVTYSFAEVFVYVTVIPAIVIIVFCHATVYLVSRRHMRRIKTEQLPSETKTKFVEEKKAIKTTSIIITFVFLSFVPSLLYGIFSRDIRQTNLRALVLSCIFLNSLLNPVIHCWRNKYLRKGMMELLKMRQNEN